MSYDASACGAGIDTKPLNILYYCRKPDLLFAWKVKFAMKRSIARSVRQPQSLRGGFTLTEVLLVLAILGVIAAMVVPNLLGRQQEALVKSTKMSIKSMQDACEQYAISHDGQFPQGGRDEVIQLLMNPGADVDGKPISPYLKEVPKDAWQQPLYYEYPNTKVANAVGPAIWSSGPDRKSDDGANDDVKLWGNN
jgi:general secretion pathway protein G